MAHLRAVKEKINAETELMQLLACDHCSRTLKCSSLCYLVECLCIRDQVLMHSLLLFLSVARQHCCHS